MGTQEERRPNPGDSFKINGKTFVFPAGKIGVPCEIGKAARVYQVTEGSQRRHALKVFFPQFRSHANINHAELLSEYKSLYGLAVAERYVIAARDQHILRSFPQFENAILMPWVVGESWQNYILKKTLISVDQGLSLARELTKVVAGLEAKGLAHCDLSNGNFVFSSDFSDVELVDIEEMYAREFSAPSSPPVGTDGYAPLIAVKKGYYGPDADRHALGILIAEILCWQFADIREQRESLSLFASDEFGYKSTRYKLVKQHLTEIQSNDGLNAKNISDLFDRVWFSRWKNPDTREEHQTPHEIYKKCPSAMEWKDALGSETITVIEKAPSLATSLNELNFGRIDPSGNNLPNLSLAVTNQGGGSLSGGIIAQPWLIVTPSNNISFRKRQKTSSINISLGRNYPQTPNGGEYRHPSGLVIQTNGGTKVLGIRYTLPTRPFYKQWINWLILVAIGLCCFFVFTGTGVAAIIAPKSLPFLASNTPTKIPTKKPTKALPTKTPVKNPTKKSTSSYVQTSTAQAEATLSILSSCAASKTLSTYSTISLCDQFSSDQSLWWIGIEDTTEWGHHESSIANRKLRWVWEANQGLMHHETQVLTADDFEVTVSAKRVQGDTNGACYGIVFRESNTGYYWLKVCDSQTYSVFFSDPQDGWIEILMDTTDAIKPGAVNQITVIAKGKKFKIYINKTYVTEFSDSRLKNGQVGIGIETNSGETSIFEFDNFVLLQP